MAAGWICLYRKILDSEIWNYDNEPYSRREAWIYLLLKASRKDHKSMIDGSVIEVKRGEYFVSYRYLANAWGWSTKKVLKFLSVLEELEMITKTGHKKGTLINIVNYSVYQDITDDIGNIEETQRKHKGNIEETQRKQNTTIGNKGEQRGTKGNNNIDPKHKYGEYQHVLLTDKERDRLMDEYGEAETSEAIKYLDEYIEMKGYKAKSHYLAIRKWVFDAVNKEKEKSGTKKQSLAEQWLNA